MPADQESKQQQQQFKVLTILHMGIVMTQIPCCVPSGEMPTD
jgi:hypothetical protein